MVFESIVADLLNRFLGDYVENLDRSQLKIGIWGGDVVLNNLALKQSALDELNLPIRTIYGYLGKLVLKIPWKNLYNAPVEAQIDKLFILATPNTSIKYDGEKEEKWVQAQKQAELRKIELAKKAELEKGKPKDPDSFTEKLVTQIIRNIQISINNIHIRYEDGINRPGLPIALGVTLHSLSVKSISSWGDPVPINPLNLIFKELMLQCLSVYWNPNAKLFSKSNLTEKDYKLLFEQGIATKDMLPLDYKYILGPINSSVNLRINNKPESDGTDFTVPQILLKFEMERLLIRFAKVQFQDMLVLLDAFNRMAIQNNYRKYRPPYNEYRGHYRDWWRFAYECILETEIRRKRRNWDWMHIIHHRNICRDYAKAYKAKISTTKPTNDMIKSCYDLEKQLDVLNIILIREKIQLEVDRLGAAQEAEKEAQGGWFSRWWGGSAPKPDSPQQDVDIVSQIQNAMTPEEKQKLFKAIGYQESASPTEYPPYFVVVDLNILLHRLQLEIMNDSLPDPNVLTVKFSQVACRCEKRPQSMSVNTYVKVLSVRGCRQGDAVPRLVEPKVLTQEDMDELDSAASQPCLFKCLIELTPLDGMCDQRVHVTARPLRIIYDAVTINNIIDVFKLEQKNAMQPLQEAAQNKLAELKQKSALGLQHVIDTHSALDLQVDMMASYIIVPYKGFFLQNEAAVIMNLGRLELHSKPRPRQEDNTANVRAMFTQGHSEAEIITQMMSQSYDNFVLQLSDLQVMFKLENEDWDYERCIGSEKHYLLKPTTLTINLSVCFILDDPRLPKVKIDACLPLIALQFVEDRIINLLKLFLSIPLPESSNEDASAPQLDMKGAAAMGSTTSLSGLGIAPIKIASPNKVDSPDDENIVQMTEIIMNFVLKEVTICVMKRSWDGAEDSAEALLCFKLLSLESSLEKKTFDLMVSLSLGGVSLEQMYQDYPVNVLTTPMASGQQEYLLTVKYINVDRNSPEFHSKYGSVLQLIEFDFTKVEFLFHQEAIAHLINMSNNIAKKVKEIQEEMNSALGVNVAREEVVGFVQAQGSTSFLTAMADQKPGYTRVLSRIKEEGFVVSKPSVTSKKSKQYKRVEVIDLKITVCMKSISVGLATHEHGPIAFLGVTGGIAVITMKKSYTQIEASLMGVYVKDTELKDDRYSQIMTVVDDQEALIVNVVMFNEDEKALRKQDISVKASMACVRLIFLNRFITMITSFLNNFQAAQEMLVEASHAAAEAAKHNVQDVYSNAVRVVLDVKIKAPIIVVPVNTHEPNAFLLDLGFLSLSNNIVDVFTGENSESATLDNLQLDLQNLKLSQVVLNKDLSVMSEKLVLKPISFTLSVQRNLSSGWYNAIPDLEIGGKLHTVQLIIYKDDYSLLMRVLKENLGDSFPDKNAIINSVESDSKTTLEPSTPSVVLSSKPSFSRRISTAVTSSESKAVRKPSLGEVVNATIKFYFTIESVVLELFTGDYFDKSSVEGLAEFKLLMICVRGSQLSDSSMQLSLLLMDCVLEDTRPSQSKKIKTYMEKKVSDVTGDADSSGSNTMIDIVFQQKAEAMFLDMRVSSFILILNLEHLMMIASVFTLGEEAETDQSPAVQHHHSQAKPRPTVAAAPMVVEENKSKNLLTLNVKIDNPDIILVEKMEDINTSALMFQAEVIFKLRMLEDSQFMNGSITDMQLFSCCYNPIFRKDTKAHVLRPVSILLSGSSPKNVGLNVDISTTDIRISVTADTLQLVNSVLSTVTQNNQVVSTKSASFIDNSGMWDITSYSDSDYAFLITEVGEEVTTEMPMHVEVEKKTEVCIFCIPSLVITVEAGTGLSRMPMLLLESSVQASIKDWSSQLNVDSHFGVKLSYYNQSLALWEPLIEPVEEIVSGQSKFYPWELNIQVETNKQTQSEAFVAKNKPEMSIYISSKEVMPITITKSCVEVLNSLSASFTDAIYNPTEKRVSEQAQFVLINNTGLNIKINLVDGDFILYQYARPGIDGPDEIKVVELDSGAQVELSPIDKEFIPLESSTAKDRYINIRVVDYDCEMDVPVMRADKRFFLLNQRSASNDPWGIVSDVTVSDGVTRITLRSIIQVINHFEVPIRVYYMTAKGNEVKLVGSIEPHQRLNLPLKAIYSPTSELFFSVQGYTVSIMPFVWKDLQRTLEKTLIMQCNPKNREDKEPFYIKAVGVIEQVFFELTNRHTMASNCYNIHMRPAVVLKNLLPVDISVCAQGIPEGTNVQAGLSLQLPTVEPGSSSVVIRIPNYLDREWSCKNEINSNPSEFMVWSFESYTSKNKFTLDLGVHTIDRNGSLIMSVYCPFWMINNTGLLLSYRQADDMNNVVFHPKDVEGPIMFSFHSKTFFAKKKSCIRVGDGSWSDKFSLDVAGSSGVVISKCKDIQYQIGVHIRLTYNTLTKQIRFSPFYIIVNNYDLNVEVKECNQEEKWIKVEAQSCSPLWPLGSAKEDGFLVLRIEGTTQTTIPFHFRKPHTTVLKLDNQHGALYVDIQITEGMAYVNINPFENGMAPALILNRTNTTLDFMDKSSAESVFMLRPMERKLFCWSTSNPEDRKILFANKKASHSLKEDSIGEVSLGGDDSNKAYFVSFLYGFQRVLLVTNDSYIAQQANNISELDTISQEIEICIHGIGVSLVNNESRVEILYLGIASSGVIWEAKKTSKNRYKALSGSDSSKIEQAYGRYTAQLEAYENPPPVVKIDPKISVNFESGEMISPVKKEIRRRYNTGLWIMIKSSPTQLQFHAKINKIQIDNQMNDCLFPVIFFPVPPPKSMNMDNTFKPFVELSIVKRLNHYSTLQQYKYFKLLIQEFHVKIDICFLNALAKLFEEGEKSEKDKVANFMKDLKITHEPLMTRIVSTFEDQKNVYDILHLSPLKIHISFSLSGGGSGSDQKSAIPDFLSVFAQSFGVTLTDIQDVVFKLAYFERQNALMTQGQLISEVQHHYISQLLKQIYVLVLGLDVIGNPFGLVMGFTQGATDLFYEPFQGAIQGPGEFAEGLVLGVRSLFGHTVGGAAGAMSKITGAMGKGLAVLTFDKEYQKQRREAFSNKPQNVQEGLAQSGKGLVMGVVEGVGGVITKPISGAKEEGFQGFFKGVGKGIVGLVTRPTAGVIDFASGSFSAVKRATDTTEEVTRMRVARHFDSDGLVKPYSKLLAEGNKLLTDLDKGKYLATDVYVFHMPIGLGKHKDMLLLTDQRIAYLSHNEIFGGYQMEWFHIWSEMTEEPKIVAQGIALSIADKKKGVRMFSGSSSLGKVLLISDEHIKLFLVEKITSLMQRDTSHKRSPSFKERKDLATSL